MPRHEHHVLRCVRFQLDKGSERQAPDEWDRRAGNVDATGRSDDNVARIGFCCLPDFALSSSGTGHADGDNVDLRRRRGGTGQEQGNQPMAHAFTSSSM